MIGALARAGKVLAEPAFTKAATDTARLMIEKVYEPGTGDLARALIGGRKVGSGYAEDFVFLARGFIDLHEATGNAAALETASAFQAAADKRFFDAEVGLYHLSPIDKRDSLPLLIWPLQDTDLPSVNGVAAVNLVDLARLRGEPAPDRAKVVLTATRFTFEHNPAAVPSALRAAILLKNAPTKE